MFYSQLRCLCSCSVVRWRSSASTSTSSNMVQCNLQNSNREIIDYYMNAFSLPEYRVQSMMLKHPTLRNTDAVQLESTLHTFLKLGISKEELIDNALVLNVHSKTISNRWTVLAECHLKKITLQELRKFNSIHRIYTLSQLHKKHLLNTTRDLWSDLVECFKYWPDIQHKLLTERVDIRPEDTLNDIRMIVLKKFLCMHLKYTPSNFEHIINLYPPVKNRAFTTMTQVIHLLEQMELSKASIASYGYTLLLNPDNIFKFLSQVKTLGGLKVETVFEKYPTIMKNNYEDVLQIKNLLQREGISDEAQQKCFLLFTLCYDTVLRRINELKLENEFRGFENHPRIMSFLYNRTKIGKRMDQLKSSNKKCFSLHKLASGQKEFDRFMQSFGDHTKGVDTLHFLINKFTPIFSKDQLKHQLCGHKFWSNIPLQNIIEVMSYLEKDFNKHDLFYNCQLLLYPLEEVQKMMEILRLAHCGNMEKLNDYVSNDRTELTYTDFTIMSDFQFLSLTCYFLEKYNYFTDVAVWMKPATMGAVSINE